MDIPDADYLGSLGNVVQVTMTDVLKIPEAAKALGCTEACARAIVKGQVWDESDVAAHLTETKNGDARQVPLSPEAIRLWDLHGPFGLTEQQVDIHFRKSCAKAGIEGLHFHDSRHLAITRIAQSRKLDILELAKMIGHRNLKELMTYFNPSADDIAGKL
jgi:integrase